MANNNQPNNTASETASETATTTAPEVVTPEVEVVFNDDQQAAIRTELARRHSSKVTVMDAPANFDLTYAQTVADLETSLKALNVIEIVSPTSLLSSSEPLAESERMTLHDAFRFEIMEKGQPKWIMIFVLQDSAGRRLTVGQQMNPGRERWAIMYDNASLAGASVTMTNVVFRRLNKGQKAGNYPIILFPTVDTQNILARK